MTYAKIIDEKTKRCIVGLGDDEDYYVSEGYIKSEVEQGYDGWYIKGYAPEKPDDIKKSEVRSIRNQYLVDTDKFMITDFPISKEEKANYKSYRQYLRDYTEKENWWKQNPKTFEEWENN